MVEKRLAEGQATAVLCSAGLDSVVLLAHEARRGPVVPFYVSVGLAWEPAERDALRRLLAEPPLAALALEPVVLTFDMRDVYPATHWAVRGRPPGYDTPDEDVYLVGRNVVLLTKAGVACVDRRLSRIVLGPLAGNPFPDATPEFFEAMGRALTLGLGWPVTVDAPFRTWEKADVIRRGLELGVPLGATLSCMNPRGQQHCGACSKCRERHDAFVEAGVPDPTDYAVAPPR